MQMFKLQTTNLITIFYNSTFLPKQPIQGELHFIQDDTSQQRIHVCHSMVKLLSW